MQIEYKLYISQKVSTLLITSMHKCCFLNFSYCFADSFDRCFSKAYINSNTTSTTLDEELDIISQIRTNDTVMEFSDIPPLDRADSSGFEAPI